MLDIDAAIKHCLDIADGQDKCADISVSEHAKERIRECANGHRQLAEWLTELKEAKRLLRLGVEDFAKLDRVNTKVRNCMIPDMDCADCPLNWDSVDDSVEPCHNWRYADEALKLIGGEADD